MEEKSGVGVIPRCVRTGNYTNCDIPRAFSLIENGKDGRSRRRFENRDTDVMNIIWEEEPGFLETEGTGEGISIALGKDVRQGTFKNH